MSVPCFEERDALRINRFVAIRYARGEIALVTTILPATSLGINFGKSGISCRCLKDSLLPCGPEPTIRCGSHGMGHGAIDVSTLEDLMMRLAVPLGVASVLLMSAAAGADELKSGLQPGQHVP